jgi:hypothetical protein
VNKTLPTVKRPQAAAAKRGHCNPVTSVLIYYNLIFTSSRGHIGETYFTKMMGKTSSVCWCAPVKNDEKGANAWWWCAHVGHSSACMPLWRPRPLPFRRTLHIDRSVSYMEITRRQKADALCGYGILAFLRSRPTFPACHCTRIVVETRAAAT